MTPGGKDLKKEASFGEKPDPLLLGGEKQKENAQREGGKKKELLPLACVERGKTLRRRPIEESDSFRPGNSNISKESG